MGTEDIGARRLQTIFEGSGGHLLLGERSTGRANQIEAGFVAERIGEIAEDEDLSNFIL
ncbi:MAG: hypothetical protein R2848_19505 [Thermomicrobiales bacterium]